MRIKFTSPVFLIPVAVIACSPGAKAPVDSPRLSVQKYYEALQDKDTAGVVRLVPDGRAQQLRGNWSEFWEQAPKFSRLDVYKEDMSDGLTTATVLYSLLPSANPSQKTDTLICHLSDDHEHWKIISIGQYSPSK